MKKNLFLIALIAGLSGILASCSMNTEYHTLRKSEIVNARNEGSGCFVEFKDGTVKNYKTLIIIRGVLKTPHLLADGTTRINAKDINAYQNTDHYAISQNVYKPKKESYVAVETLPGFAIRIAKGDLNVYVRKCYNSHKAVDEFFLQTENGPIVEYSEAAMTDLIKNSPEALVFFNNKKEKTARPKKLKTTADIYNTSRSITRAK